MRNPDLTLTLSLTLTLTQILTLTLTLALALALTLTLGAYWLALGGFAVAGGHEPSLHAGARVHCALEGVRSYAVVLRVAETSLLVTPDGGELPSPQLMPRECAVAVPELEPAPNGAET